MNTEQAAPKFSFDAETHTYSLDGHPIPNVTSILEDVGIIDYSMLGDRREEYLHRGRAVHLITQYDDEGNLDESSVAPKYAGYLEAWRTFRRDCAFTPDPGGIEVQHYCPKYRYAGTLDRIGRRAADRATRILLDIKTGHAEWWVRLQTAAYAGFHQDPRTFLRLVVELHDDGTYREEAFPGSTWHQDFSLFLAALAVRNAKSGKGR